MNKRYSANVYVILSMVFGYLLSVLVAFVFKVKTETAFVTNLLNILNNVMVAGLPVLIYIIFNRKTVGDFFKKVPTKKALKLLLFVPVIWSVGMYLNIHTITWLESFGIKKVEQIPPSGETTAVVTSFILACVVAPVLEELLYRGVVLSLLKGYGKGAAVFISALLFAVAHGSVTVFVAPFISGLFMGYIVMKSGNLFLSMLVHSGCNLISWLIMTVDMSQAVGAAVSILMVLIGSAGCIWAVLKLGKNTHRLPALFKQLWGYLKNPTWIIILANFVFVNFLNHG